MVRIEGTLCFQKKIHRESRGNTTQYFIGDATHNDASWARTPGNQATGDRGGHPDDLQLDHCPSHIDIGITSNTSGDFSNFKQFLRFHRHAQRSSITCNLQTNCNTF